MCTKRIADEQMDVFRSLSPAVFGLTVLLIAAGLWFLLGPKLRRAWRWRVERAMRRSGDAWSITFDTVPDLICLLDAEHRIMRANRAFAERLGKTAAEVVGQTCHECLGCGDGPPEDCPHTRTLRDHQPQSVEKFHQGLGGHFLVTTSPLFDEGGVVTGSVCVLRDINKRKRAERLLRAERDLAEALADAADLDGALDLVLDAALEAAEIRAGGIYLVDEPSGDLVLQRTRGLRATFVEAVRRFPPDWPAARQVMRGEAVHAQLGDLGIPASDAVRLEGVHGVLAVPIRQDHKVIGCINAASHSDEPIPDATRHALETIANLAGAFLARRRWEGALVESERRLRTLMSNLPGMAYRCLNKPEWPMVFLSDGCRALTGYSTDEMAVGGSVNYGDIIHADDQERVWRGVQAAVNGGGHFEFEYRITAKDGREKWVWERGRAVSPDGDGVIALEGFISDVTDRRQAREELRESEARYRGLFTAITDAFYAWSFRADGAPESFFEVNDVACRMLGYTRAELLCMTIRDIDAPESKVDVAEVLDRLRRGEEVLFRQCHVAKDGRRVPVEIHARAGAHRGNLAIFSTVRDISERIKAEEDRLTFERRVQQTQKLESLGVLAGGIAHDFSNILMSVLGNADLALAELSPVSPARGNIEEIEKASRRAAELCREMLAYSGKGRFVVGSISLSELIEEMLHLLRASISKKAVLNVRLEQDLPRIRGDATQVRQVVMNLVINASEAIGERGGVINVSAGAGECSAEYLNGPYLNENIPAGRYVWIEVSDTGCGMDRDTLERLFEPFFTTKFTGRGLGLSATLGIVRGHKGAIKVASDPGKGTTFRILFPADDGTGGDAVGESAGSAAAGWRGHGTLLLVDDEENVRSVARAMIERLGFEVVTAVDGRDAIDVYRRCAPGIAAVILDLTMPGMDGEETFRELRRMDPAVPVVISSGYSEHEIVERFTRHGSVGFIQKPYTLAALASCLRSATEEPGAARA